LDAAEVAAFLADLGTHRDRAVTLAMLLGGLRAGEVRRLKLTDVDQGLRRLRVRGKGGRERVVPVDRAFFVELAAYLRVERPPGLATPECFVVLEGATAGAALTEAGLRSVFRHHRRTSGALRVRPHRLRHTYGTELAAAGIDLLVLRELMGHASPETTAGYVHLSAEHLAARVCRRPGGAGRQRQGDGTVTAAVARVATTADHPLLAGYVAHCRALQVSDRALRDRLRLARQFLACHPDLDAWMARPLVPAWPICVGSGPGRCSATRCWRAGFASTSTCWSPRTSAASAARPR
jgi:hypothetical protein